MVSVQIAALVVALSAPGDTVLLDFHAPWCGPCQSMKGTIDQLEHAGYPVRRVNVDSERHLAQQYNIHNIPCFVLLVDGREAGRVTGAASAKELASMFARAGVSPGSLAANVRSQSPDPERPRFSIPGRPARVAARDARLNPQPQPLPPRGIETSSRAEAVAPDELVSSSVRLTITDPEGASYGSGTIIDSRAGEALVLTCGHIFRDSQGKGQISVDLLGPGAPQKIPGRIVSYDLKNDIGLVSIKTPVPVRVAPVASKDYMAAKGDSVVTVGCNNGGPATAIPSTVTAINKFLGPSNLQVAGMPVQGRSGGGLFSADGRVIGVCNAADPTDNEGLYAGLPVIHQELDKVGLSAIYQNPQPTAPPTAAPAPPQGMPVAMAAANQLPGPAPDSMGQEFGDMDPEAIAQLRRASHGAEVICIVRPLSNPRAKSEVIMLDRASPAFLQQLAVDREAQASRHLTSLNVPAQGTQAPVRR